MSRIREQYVNTGQVRFAYKHFAILGPESNLSAEASECAAEQGQFWVYHDKVFADQIANRSGLNSDRLTELAGELGLDTNIFRECLDSGKYGNQITQESLSVQSLGVRGTPAFLINGVFISGAQPFEVFQQVFEEQLAQPQLGVESAPVSPPTTEPTTSPSTDEPVGETKDAEIEGVIFFPEQSRDHEDGDIEYDHAVPPGGVHSEEWQNCGIYNESLAEEPVMHSLEHGAVWVAYRPNLPDQQVEILQNIVRGELQAGLEPLVLLSPQPELDAPIVISAWQVQLQLDDANDARLPLFLKKYQNGPYTPEPGAPCSNGIGQPVK
ncbi:MAG: DUF3105 domain-containing protein [Anaerolineae bacterium]|nr:DUF3105 domain-containing protein [Anaerolineae bacterium]